MEILQKEMYIFLDQVKFYAYHGVAAQETLVGNVFILDLKLKTNFEQAIQTDELTYTVSYADIYEIVKKEMEIPSKLLEHVAGRIASRLFATYSSIEEIYLKLAKQNPPIGGELAGAGVILQLKRP